MPLGGGVRILLRMSIPASLSVVESRGGIAGPVLTLPPPALVSVGVSVAGLKVVVTLHLIFYVITEVRKLRTERETQDKSHLYWELAEYSHQSTNKNFLYPLECLSNTHGIIQNKTS